MGLLEFLLYKVESLKPLWCFMLAILAIGRQRQEDHQNFEAIVWYRVRLYWKEERKIWRKEGRKEMFPLPLLSIWHLVGTQQTLMKWTTSEEILVST